MENTTKQYNTVIANHEYTFTAHSTKAGARATINESLNPCLVEVFVDGKTMYDAFPAGHPISEEAEIIERCRLTASGYRWKPVAPREDRGR
jgi:hypothetical protein